MRHKILDAIGDLALLGHPVVGHLEASKAGHALHAALAREAAGDARGLGAGHASAAAGGDLAVAGVPAPLAPQRG